MAKQLLNSEWWARGYKRLPVSDDPIQTKETLRRSPWLVDSPLVLYETYEECAGQCDPKSETPIQVTVSIIGTQKRVTLD